MLAAGCAAVGEDYRQPRAAVAESWSRDSRPGSVSLEQWWIVFGDERLAQLIERARASNLDLEAAASSVREARAALGASRAALAPSLDASLGASRSRQSLESRAGAPFFGHRESSLFDVGFDARWELDVFGGLRRDVEAAEADLGSVEEAHRGVLVSLTAETARAYLELCGLRRKLRIVRDRVEMQSQLAEIVSVRARAGVASDLDAARADAQVASGRAEIPALEARIAEREHALAVLLGLPPRDASAEFGDASVTPVADVALALGQPADLLRRRPDLRAAERRCAAASARAASAFAARYPRVSLGAGFGWLANETGDLFRSSSVAASIGPSISLPLFDAGLRRARFEAATERENQAVLAYQDAVLAAAKEVEDALSGLAGATERRATLRTAVESQTRAATYSLDLYSSGVVDFLTVLDAERELYALQDQLAASETDCALQVVALAKSFGGGWDPQRLPSVAEVGAPR
jgi:NodT family efflux transporter outer membrane factor (OMF) lipoprotein